MNLRRVPGEQRYVDGVGFLNTGSIPVPSLSPLRSLSHQRAVSAIAFNDDGSLLVSGSEDNAIRIWNTWSGEEVLGPLEGHMDFVRSVCWKGTFIASAADDTTVRLWCCESGTALALFSGHQVPI
jgi:WD40 repeat protein